MTAQQQSQAGAPKRITYDVCYSVPTGNSDRDRFVRCGTGRQCKNGHGFRLQLDAIPVADIGSFLYVFPQRESTRVPQKQVPKSEKT